MKIQVNRQEALALAKAAESIAPGKAVMDELRCVLLEAGDHSVEATYEIPGLRIGGMVSGAALVFTGCALVGSAIRRRRGSGQKGGKRRKRNQIQEVEES